MNRKTDGLKPPLRHFGPQDGTLSRPVDGEVHTQLVLLPFCLPGTLPGITPGIPGVFEFICSPSAASLSG